MHQSDNLANSLCACWKAVPLEALTQVEVDIECESAGRSAAADTGRAELQLRNRLQRTRAELDHRQSERVKCFAAANLRMSLGTRAKAISFHSCKHHELRRLQLNDLQGRTVPQQHQLTCAQPRRCEPSASPRRALLTLNYPKAHSTTHTSKGTSVRSLSLQLAAPHTAQLQGRQRDDGEHDAQADIVAVCGVGEAANLDHRRVCACDGGF